MILLRKEKDIQKEMEEMEEFIEQQKNVQFREMLKIPIVRKGLIVGIGLAFFQQITGQPTLILYVPTILKMTSAFESIRRCIMASVGKIH